MTAVRNIVLFVLAFVAVLLLLNEVAGACPRGPDRSERSERFWNLSGPQQMEWLELHRVQCFIPEGCPARPGG